LSHITLVRHDRALGLLRWLGIPAILKALNPGYAIDLIVADPAQALSCWFGRSGVTGAEALYADMGHFGPSTHSAGLVALVFPALLLNYSVRGASSRDPAAIDTPFFLRCPGLAVYPVVGLASTATVTLAGGNLRRLFADPAGGAARLSAAHAVAITRTGDRAGLCARDERDLAGGSRRDRTRFPLHECARGPTASAVTGTMMVDTLLASPFFWLAARWPLWQLVPLSGMFLAVDLSFLAANLLRSRRAVGPSDIGGVLFAV